MFEPASRDALAGAIERGLAWQKDEVRESPVVFLSRPGELVLGVWAADVLGYALIGTTEDPERALTLMREFVVSADGDVCGRPVRACADIIGIEVGLAARTQLLQAWGLNSRQILARLRSGDLEIPAGQPGAWLFAA